MGRAVGVVWPAAGIFSANDLADNRSVVLDSTEVIRTKLFCHVVTVGLVGYTQVCVAHIVPVCIATCTHTVYLIIYSAG